MVQKDVSDRSVLDLVTYEKCVEKLETINQPLSCELEDTPIFEAAVMNLTTTIELSKGHSLHVNSKLSAQ